MKLNLGCGKDIMEGYTNVDSEKFSGVDLILDLNKIPYPFEENQVDEIIMRSILEHLNEPYEVLKEIHRISKPGAKIFISVPHFSSDTTWGDIQHKRGYGTQVFKEKHVAKYFTLKKQEIVFNRFRIFMPFIANKFPRLYEKTMAYIFQASYIDIELGVIK